MQMSSCDARTDLIAGCATATTSSIVFHFFVVCNTGAKPADFIPRDAWKKRRPNAHFLKSARRQCIKRHPHNAFVAKKSEPRKEESQTRHLSHSIYPRAAAT
jgi:hypothetical protein